MECHGVGTFQRCTIRVHVPLINFAKIISYIVAIIRIYMVEIDNYHHIRGI